MRTIPHPSGIGTIPLRTSKNPVLGVFRHHCGEVATVHQPRGPKKAHLRYFMCDKCGCDQSSGAEYQQQVRDSTYQTIEELLAAENGTDTVKPSETLDLAVSEQVDSVQAQPVEHTNIPPETPKQAVSEQLTVNTVKPSAHTIEPTNKPNVSVENQPVHHNQKPKNPFKIVFCALGGAVFGGLLALAS